MARTLEQLDAAFDEHVKDSDQGRADMTKEIQGLREDLKPMIDLMTSGKVLDRVARYCLGAFIGLVGLLVALKELNFWHLIRGILK